MTDQEIAGLAYRPLLTQKTGEIMLKILHTADWHMRDKDIVEIENCLLYIVNVAETERPDIIIHCGDVFDSAGVRADSLSAKLAFKTFQELSNIAPIAIVIGTPSHDGKVAETLKYIKARYPVHISTKPEQIYLCEGDIGIDPSRFRRTEAPIEAVISMTPAPTKQYFQTNNGIKDSNSEIAAEMSKIFMGFATQAAAYSAVPHISVGHWQVDGAMISETQTLFGTDISISKDQMALANADIILLGHIHHCQDMGNNIFYSGSITGLNWGETSAKGFFIHEFSGKELIETSFIKTPSKKLIKIPENLTSGGAIEHVNNSIPLFTDNEITDAYLKLEFKVYQDEAALIDTNKIKKAYLSIGAKEVTINLIRVPRENVRSKTILNLTTLRDKLVEMAKLKGEIIPESILCKADILESKAGGEIIRGISVENL